MTQTLRQIIRDRLKLSTAEKYTSASIGPPVHGRQRERNFGFTVESHVVRSGPNNGAVLSGVYQGHAFRAMWFESAETLFWRAAVTRGGLWVHSFDGDARRAPDADALVRAAVEIAIAQMLKRTTAHVVLRLPGAASRPEGSRAQGAISTVQAPELEAL